MDKLNLLICPNCYPNGKGSALGILMDDGSISVQRGHDGVTIVKAPTISCGCGYTFILKDGKVID